MFSSSLRSALIILVASAVAVSAVPGLSVKVSGPQRVDGVDKLTVAATVTNTGDETLKLLNEPRGPLSNLPTDIFAITHHESGASPTFIGARAKYVPSIAIKYGEENAFTVLAPGQSISLQHDLSTTYNFTSSGAGNYKIEAFNRFYFVHPDTLEPVELWANAEAHSTAVSGTLAVSRCADLDCGLSKQTVINAAIPKAQVYASSAYQWLMTHNATTRYITWFGDYDANRFNTVVSHFKNLNGTASDFSKFTYDCSTCNTTEVAYVYASKFGKVYLCPAFFRLQVTGTDSQAGSIVHEASHFTANGGTKDWAYGQTSCKKLAMTLPKNATENADSHEYYAENTPPLN